MSDDQLFDTTAYEATPVVTPDMGHDAARTALRRNLIANGIHPATHLALLSGNKTCGDCAHLILKDGPMLGVGSGRWWKCTQTLSPSGRGPDMTKSWPACSAFTPVEGGAE